MNDGTAESLCSLSYVNVSNAARAVVARGEPSWLKWMCAGCNVPIHLEDQRLLGIRWEGSLYINTALPFVLCWP